MKRGRNINQIKRKKHVYNEEVLRELAEEEAKLRRARVKKALIGLAVAAVIVIALLVWFFVERAHQYESFSVTQADEQATQMELAGIGSRIIKYGTDGLICMTDDLETKWSHGYSMTSPVTKTSGDYLLIYDKNGTSLVLMTEDGIATSFESPRPVVLADVSDYGMTTVLTADGNAGLINFFDKTGRKLDIEVKNVLAGESGYPVSMSLSPSGTGLVLSLLFVDLGSMQSRISFLNFDAGKDTADRVVGFYNYDGTIFPQVDYITSTRVVAYGDNRAVFYSLDKETSPESLTEIAYNERIESVITGCEMACVITRSEQGGLTLHLYNASGEEKLSYNFDFAYTRAEISGGYLMLYGGEKMLIIDTSGHVKYNGDANGLAGSMVSTGKNSFLQAGEFGLRHIKLD